MEKQYWKTHKKYWINKRGSKQNGCVYGCTSKGCECDNVNIFFQGNRQSTETSFMTMERETAIKLFETLGRYLSCTK